jgi:uncharacterized protein (AIM24 family)
MPRHEEEVEGQDEEFLFHLNRGSDLLLRGEADPARGPLERALELRPKDPNALGLLGQAHYRLGRFEEAARVWQRLVDDNPVEAGARVNLGLAFLKARRFPEAVKQLEIALDLSGEHRKAMGYLGLALLESGEVRRAREWFARAGSEQMVVRCDEILAGGGRGSAAPAPEGAPGSNGSASAPMEPLLTPVPGTYAVVGATGEAATPTATSPSSSPPTAATPSRPHLGLAAWAAARDVSAPLDTFTVGKGTLAIRVHGEVRARLAGLAAASGALEIAPERQRLRGKPAEAPFGVGTRAFSRVTGDGLLVLGSPRALTAVALGEDAAFLREEALLAMDGAVSFENGRVVSEAGDLDLVHVRGDGGVVLATGGAPVSIEVRPGAPARVPRAALVGWVGTLALRLEADPRGGGPLVELTGEGRVLVDPLPPGAEG